MKSRKIGLARALSKFGYCSRSKAFALIRAGRVRLNGKLRRDPEFSVRMEDDRIEVDGAPICAAGFQYLMLNKPRGVVTTAADEKHRRTVYDLLPPHTSWLGPVGRLDKASEGLLLLTNDSEWAARITAPESHLPKRYHVQVPCNSPDEVANRIRQGVESDNEFLRVRGVRVLRHGHVHAWFEVVLDEGRNRHIRRMLEQIGVECVRLVRVAIGPLELGELPKGQARPLTGKEKDSIDESLRAGPLKSAENLGPEA
jgi:23S rRNA pseudouridine2605 synthase